jgi:hypothetical protein
MAIPAFAFAAGTVDNWHAELTFSTTNKTDMFPIRVGEGSAATELLKPPPMPGMSLTGNSEDAVVNGYVLTTDAKVAARSIQLKDAGEPGRIWPVRIEVEEPGAVYMTADLAQFHPTYDLSIIVPSTKRLISFSTHNERKQIFTATEAGENTIFVMAGKTKTFFASDGNDAFGAVRLAKINVMKEGVKVYVNGVEKDVTDANGMFEISGLSAGNHTVRLDSKYILGSQFTVTVSGTGTYARMVDDLYAGDFNDDGKISIADLGPLKLCFGLGAETIVTVNSESYTCANTDVNGDGNITMQDFSVLKTGFGKEQTW